MKPHACFAFLASAITCSLVWALSPLLTGEAEPWDVPGLFYFEAIVVAGSLAGAIAPKPIWAHYPGAVIGQLVYMVLFIPSGPLAAVGIVILVVYAFIPFAAAAAAGCVRLLFVK